MNDSISNLIVNLKNAGLTHKDSITIANSTKIENIVKILVQEGFVEGYTVSDIGNNKKTLTITLKYTNNKNSVITDIKQVSKPSLRIYIESNNIPHIKNGLGLAIISTNKGIVSDKYARANNVGGEFILKV
jgi:small subunit ribosomal protein S8